MCYNGWRKEWPDKAGEIERFHQALAYSYWPGLAAGYDMRAGASVKDAR